jgi:TonB-linked SusC/RagA family outer membrane protein
MKGSLKTPAGKLSVNYLKVLNMKKKYIQILAFPVFLLIILLTTDGSAQNARGKDRVTIQSVVKDANGLPVCGALIYGNEGAIIAKTDETGQFSISVPNQTDLLIEAEGYEPAIFRSGEYLNLTEFSLKPSLFYHGANDNINIAFGKIKKGDLVNAVSTVNADEIRKFDNVQDIYEALNGRVPGMLGSTNVRGIGNALFIVDGLPRDINTINLAEVEQISILKDLNSSMLYGNEAVNGVVLVTTKRGEPYKRRIDVSGYYGISVPKMLPKYLSSADYMELYNEARINDGLAPQYSDEAIANYRQGNPYRYPSVDYYSDEYLRGYKPYSRIMTELSGGNDLATYYTNIGWYRTGSLLDFGEGKNGQRNQFTIRGNVDLKINSWIKSALDAVAVLDNNKGPVGNYWSSAATLRPNLFSPLLPISLIDPENELLNGRKNDVDGMYLLGGTSSYLTNPIADGYSGGVNENIQRTFSFNNRIDFDLSHFIRGLAFHTNFSFDFYNIYNQSINNGYSVYEPVWNPVDDNIIYLTKYGTDTRSGTQNIGSSSFQRRFGFYAMFDYKRTFGEHRVYGSLLGYGNRYKEQGDLQGNKYTNLGLRGIYSYKNTYLVDFSSAYVNSVKLAKGNKGAFSPSMGLAWVISNEGFMLQASAINYLKLRLSAGLMNSDAGIDGFFYYDNSYSGTGGYSWFDGSRSGYGRRSANGANLNLGYEKRRDINLGFESVLFNHKLSVDANLFSSVYYDQITRTQTQYPGFYTDYIPYENFDSNSYKGGEMGISYKQNLGDITLVIGANALVATSKVEKKDEIYSNDYQYRKGHPADARFGLVAEGYFANQSDIDNHAIQAFGKVAPGDIKYADQNDDGIVDGNDEVQIGRWQAPFSYGLNLRLSYKNFTLALKGNGRTGADGYISGDYYQVDGDDKYSEYILERWTETTKTTATLPRLSSVANTNNYRTSDFWQYRDNWFTLDRVQLSYDVPENVAKIVKMKHLNFFVDASSVLTVSKYREYKELRTGSEPNYRSFSIGLKTMF